MAGERVLILVQNEPVPSDRHVWNESTALARAGYDVTVICPTGERRDTAPSELIDGISIHRYPPRRTGGRAAGYALEYLSALWSMGRIASRLSSEQPFDIVHACSPPDFLLLAALPLRRRGAKFVFDHHDLTPELYLSRFGGRALHRATLRAERVAFRLADIVLSVNDSYRRVAIDRGKRDPEDVFVVRTGPDLERFTPGPPSPELKRGKRFLLAYVGVMGEQDGVDHALRALAELRRRRADWHAVFMGDGDVFEEMRSLAVELALGDCVEFTGWVEQDSICRTLSTADVCLAPDPRGPLNDISSMVKVSEYMAMARPIVSFDLSESRFTAGDAAVFAETEDHPAFAQLVSELLDDPERRAAMGAAGRKRAESLLAWSRQEQTLLAAYGRALAEPSTMLIRRKQREYSPAPRL
jgi:glycosyltransferase involved in cell wall biosynthesis